MRVGASRAAGSTDQRARCSSDELVVTATVMAMSGGSWESPWVSAASGRKEVLTAAQRRQDLVDALGPGLARLVAEQHAGGRQVHALDVRRPTGSVHHRVANIQGRLDGAREEAAGVRGADVRV